MEEIIIKIGKDICISVKGEYCKGEEDVGIPEYFEIYEIESIFKDIYPFIEWVSALKDPFTRLEEMALDEYNNQ